jgi:hypothetical protein
MGCMATELRAADAQAGQVLAVEDAPSLGVGNTRKQQKAGKMINASTVFDVGLHTGQDTAYYLSLGHRVVAVEANPRGTELWCDVHAKAGAV